MKKNNNKSNVCTQARGRVCVRVMKEAMKQKKRIYEIRDPSIKAEIKTH